MKTNTTRRITMHRRSLLLAVAIGIASTLTPIRVHAALYVANVSTSTVGEYNATTGAAIAA